MEYILADKLKVTRPVIFLCGPYWDKNDKADRRNILRENIHSIYKAQKQDVLPLIVDLFLTDKNIDYAEYSVQMLEEICAAVSCQTHILLDTMSAATELGIFANSAYSNEICVYIPKQSDVYNQGNVGYFVREAVLKKPNGNINYVEYRPKIVKKAYSSVFVAEHYAFNEERIPSNIKFLLEESARANKLTSDQVIVFQESNNMPSEPNQVTYSFVDEKLTVNISIKLLFYIVTSIMHQECDGITKGSVHELSYEETESICNHAISAVANSVLFRLGMEKNNCKSICIFTIFCEDIEIVIRHIIKFVLIYYTKSQFKSMWLTESSAFVAVKRVVKKHPNIIFGLNEEQTNVLHQIVDNSQICYEKQKIKVGKKEREIVKYADNEWGRKARELHRSMNKYFRKIYKHSEFSFAYHKECSIRRCVVRHISSRAFIKIDIKNFFNSISKTILLEKMMLDWEIEQNYKWVLENILSCCFYDGKLQLGLVMSPIISDYYLYDFDIALGEYCKSNSLIFTRYADDIMISSEEEIDELIYERVLAKVSELLSDLKLKINDGKCQYVIFDNNHSFVRYLGVNIVKGKNGVSNYLSVGKKYIYSLAKEFIQYDKYCNIVIDTIEKEELDKLRETLFYTRLALIGKIGFIKQIEGERGVERLKGRLKKYYPDIDLNTL